MVDVYTHTPTELISFRCQYHFAGSVHVCSVLTAPLSQASLGLLWPSLVPLYAVILHRQYTSSAVGTPSEKPGKCLCTCLALLLLRPSNMPYFPTHPQMIFFFNKVEECVKQFKLLDSPTPASQVSQKLGLHNVFFPPITITNNIFNITVNSPL